MKKSPLKKIKVKSVTWYRKKCVEEAKKKAKERDNYVCQRCFKKVEGSNAHGSHILNEGSYPLISAEPDNIITLCYRDHINWWHKCPHDASEWFNEKWPGRIKELRAMNEEKKTHLVNWQREYEKISTF